MKKLQIPQKLYEKFYAHEKIYVHEIAAIDLSKVYFLKNAKNTCKPNNHNLNHDWIISYKLSLSIYIRGSKFPYHNCHVLFPS